MWQAGGSLSAPKERILLLRFLSPPCSTRTTTLFSESLLHLLHPLFFSFLSDWEFTFQSGVSPDASPPTSSHLPLAGRQSQWWRLRGASCLFSYEKKIRSETARRDKMKAAKIWTVTHQECFKRKKKVFFMVWHHYHNSMISIDWSGCASALHQFSREAAVLSLKQNLKS